MENKNKPTFQKLKGYLSENDISRKRLAEIVKKAPSTIHRKISGETLWDWSELVAIKKELNMSNETFISIFFDNEVTEM